MKINSAVLKIIIPIDISHFNSHIENIKHVLKTTEHLCKQTPIIHLNTDCYSMFQPLIVRYHDLDKGFGAISHLSNNRVKRSSWFGGVGTVLKHIIGTLDEDDAVKYDQAIDSVQNDIKQLSHLMKENILVTTSVLSYYNESLNKIKNNEIILNNAVNNLSLNLKNISELTNGFQIWSHINKIFDSLESSILTLSFQLEDITNAILFSSQNILHPAMITPQQLYQELADNYRYLPNSLELPIPLDISSVHIILRLCKIICYYINNKIVFLLQVPLVKVDQYMLFHNIALPTPYNSKHPNSFSLIIPSSKHIAMTKDKTHYCNVDNLELCTTIQPGVFICDVPNIYSIDAKPSCESEFLSKIISEVPKQCDTKFIFGNLDIWKPLQNNRWLYVQTKPNKVSIDCISYMHEINIVGTGILTIPDHCTAFCKSTTLTPKYNVLNITSPINSVPAFNVINDPCCNYAKFNVVIDNVSPINLQNIDLDEINSKSKLLTNSFLHSLNNIENKPHIIEYGTHYSTLIMVITFLVILYLSFLSYKILRHFILFYKNKKTVMDELPTEQNLKHTEIEIQDFAPTRTQI